MNYMDKINNTPHKEYTENGNIAYGWSTVSIPANETQLQEMISQFFFQCTLNDSLNPYKLNTKYYELLYACKNMDFEKSEIKRDTYFDIILKLILHTRDIPSGKGMYEMSYHMIETLGYISYELGWVAKTMFIEILKRFVSEFIISVDDMKKQLPYGSWKDLKLFCEHMMVSNRTKQETRIQMIYDIIHELYVPQMVEDRKNMSIQKPISLCGKWLPRESSSGFKWLSKEIARAYYHHVFGFEPKKTTIFMVHYRKLCSQFNTYLNTTQVHMCEKKWDEIDFKHVTGQTMLRQKQSFLNHKNVPEEHRIRCKENLEAYIAAKVASNSSITGKTIFPHQLVKQLLDGNSLQYENVETDKDIINLQWKGMIEHIQQQVENTLKTSRVQDQDHFMKYCISCIDVSPSMKGFNALPLYAAIGMGLMSMEFSNYKRCFTFSETPQWITFPHSNKSTLKFTEKVEIVEKSEWGQTTDIIKMFEMILDVCVKNNIPDEEVSKINLIIFSDMQFNDCQSIINDDTSDENDIVKTVTRMFRKKHYKNIPFLVFWNLRSTNNFPTIENTPYSLKMSGTSSALFKTFLTQTNTYIRSLTSWSLIQEILSDIRYTLP